MQLFCILLSLIYLKADLICHIGGWHLIKEGTFSSKYANYKNVFMKHAICYLQECIYETCNTAVFVCLFTTQSLLIRDLAKGFEAWSQPLGH